MSLLKKFNKFAHKKTVLALMPFALLTSSQSVDVQSVHLPTAQELIEKSGGLLTQDQAQARANGAYKRYRSNLDIFTNTRTNADIYYNHCFQLDYTQDQVPASVKKFYRNLDDIRTSDGQVATHLRNHSVDADIFMCFSDELAAVTRGMWQFGSPEGVVRFNRCTNFDSRMKFTALHELFHSVQEDNGLSKRNYAHSVYDLQMGNMAIEAAARVTPRLHEFETYLAGNENNFLNDRSDKGLDRAINRTYHDAIEQGQTHTRALEMAGAAAWDAVFDMQWWLDSYNSSAIRKFVAYYQMNRLERLSGEGYTVENAQMSGQFDENFNFTRDVNSLPSIDRRIGSNQDYRQIFQFLMVEQLKETSGSNSQDYKNALAQAQADNNPYLGVNLDDVNFNHAGKNAVQQIQHLANGGERLADTPRRKTGAEFTAPSCS